MSLRDEFYDNGEEGRGPRLGSRGPCWNGKAHPDFVRGAVESVAVKVGTKLNSSEPSRKMVIVLTDAVGHITTDDDDGNRSARKFATHDESPFVSVVMDGPRGAALAQAFDDAPEDCPLWLQVRYAGQGPKKDRNKSRPTYLEIKIWDRVPAPGVDPVVTLDMSAERSERAPLAVPEEAVAL
jgi:hypothetical protein